MLSTTLDSPNNCQAYRNNGCSTGVKKINSKEALERYAEAAFRREEILTASDIEALNLKLE